MKEKKDRVDDALHATRAAVEEGIVPGGGVAYIRAIESLDAKVRGQIADEQTGMAIVRRALEEPLRRLLLMQVLKVLSWYKRSKKEKMILVSMPVQKFTRTCSKLVLSILLKLAV